VCRLASESDSEIGISVPGGRGRLSEPLGDWGGWVGVLGREGVGLVGGIFLLFFLAQLICAYDLSLQHLIW